MDIVQMGERCPGAVLIGTGKIDGYRFIINSRGVATVVPDPSSDVYGVLWNLTAAHEETLDTYEGVEWGAYEKVEMAVEIISRGSFSALVYVAKDKIPGIPRDGYMEKIAAAAEIHRLPDGYFVELKSWLERTSLK